MSRSVLITYEGLPKNGGGMHSLRTKSSTASWAKIRRFLDECFLTTEPLVARLDVRRQGDLPGMDSLVDRFVGALGSPISGHDSTATYLNWFLDDAQLDEVLPVIDSLPETCVDTFGRQLVRVIVKASHPKLKDLECKILPNQGGDEYLGFEGVPDRILGENYFDAELGRNSFLYAFLSLPFEQPNTDFLDYANFLRANFPCTMSKSTWKTWKLTKSGLAYVGKKMKPDSVAASVR